MSVLARRLRRPRRDGATRGSAPAPPADAGDGAPAWTTPPSSPTPRRRPKRSGASAATTSAASSPRPPTRSPAPATASAPPATPSSPRSPPPARTCAPHAPPARPTRRRSPPSPASSRPSAPPTPSRAGASARWPTRSPPPAPSSPRTRRAPRPRALELEAARAELAAARATGAAELADARRDATQARAEVASLREALEAERARPAPGERRPRTPRPRAGRSRRGGRPPPARGVRDAAREPRRRRGRPARRGAAGRAAGVDRRGARVRRRERAAGPRRDDARRRCARVQRRRGAATDLPAADARLAESRDAGTTALGAAEQSSDPGRRRGGRVGVVAARARSTALVAASADRRLRRALVALAREDSVAAGALLVGLLPAQGAVLDGVLTYDLTVRGVGTFAVFVEGGVGARRAPLAPPAAQRGAVPPLGRAARAGRVARGRTRQGRAVPAQGEGLRSAQAARASSRRCATRGSRSPTRSGPARGSSPGSSTARCRSRSTPSGPAGTCSRSRSRSSSSRPRPGTSAARDGLPLRVVERRTDARADATVTMTRAAFERMLRDEPPSRRPPADPRRPRGRRGAQALDGPRPQLSEAELSAIARQVDARAVAGRAARPGVRAAARERRLRRRG